MVARTGGDHHGKARLLGRDGSLGFLTPDPDHPTGRGSPGQVRRGPSGAARAKMPSGTHGDRRMPTEARNEGSCRRPSTMSTARPFHHDGELGEGLQGHHEVVGEISPILEDRGGRRATSEIPAVGTEAFERAESSPRGPDPRKRSPASSRGPNGDELERLQRICGAAVDKAFPLPPADLESLIRLRDSLRAEKEGRRSMTLPSPFEYPSWPHSSPARPGGIQGLREFQGLAPR